VGELQMLVHGKGGHAPPPQASLRSNKAKKKAPVRLVKSESAKVIPFDDESRGSSERKIGDASGF
jgi:hypothetical protein